MIVAHVLRGLFDETNSPATMNFYQHVVRVDFPGEVVKVHSAESYLLVFDLYSTHT